MCELNIAKSSIEIAVEVIAQNYAILNSLKQPLPREISGIHEDPHGQTIYTVGNDTYYVHNPETNLNGWTV